MNIWHIAVKEIRSNLRDTRTFLFMLAFPIVLMLILGTALSNAFGSGSNIGDLRLLAKRQTANTQLAAAWDGFAESLGREGVKIDRAEPGVDGREEVRSGRYIAYAEVGDDGIRFYGSSKNTVESDILQGMLTAFAGRYSLVSAAYGIDPASASTLASGSGPSGDFVKETALNPGKRPGSIDYYAIAMTTMIALYSVMSASALFRGERTRHTSIRLMAAPVSRGEIFIGKIAGCTFINLLCVMAVFLFSKFAFGADWGSHYGAVFLVLLTEVILAVSFGLGVSFLVKGDGAASVMTIFAQIASFLGGAYFPLGDTEGFMSVLTQLSPLRWANTALMQIIYNDNAAAVWPVVVLNIGVAAAFLIVAVYSMHKREAL